MRKRMLLVAALTGATLMIGLTGCPNLLTAGDPTTSPSDATDPTPTPSSNPTTTSLHEGTISANETWTKAQSPHIVRGSVYVGSSSGATLTIEPGAEVRFEQGSGLYFGWTESGTLNAAGTSTESITFTSARSSKAQGDWDQIYIGTGGASTVMSYCQVEYGGGDGGGNHSVLRVSGAVNKPTIRHCTFEHNAGTGIDVDAGASFAAFENNTVKTSGNSPIRLDGMAVGTLGAGNTFVENAYQAIEVLGSTVSQSRTWRNFGLPYVIGGDLYVQASNGSPVLTLEKGNTLQFVQASGLYLGWSGSGALNATGTSTESITFTSSRANKAPGDWEQLYVGDGGASTTMSYCRLEYGGGDGGSNHSVLRVSGAVNKPTIRHCTFEHNAGTGIDVDAGASFAAFENNAVQTSGTSPVILDATAAGTLGAGNTFVGNGMQAIEIMASTVASNVRWRNFGLPYVILGDTYVQSTSITPVLTIDAGNTVRFAQGAGLFVTWINATGALYAVGTSTAPITFTSVENSPTPGTWDQLYFGNGTVDGALDLSGGTCLKYVVIEYAGSNGSTAVRIDNSKPVMENVTVRNCTGFGLTVTGQSLNVPGLTTLQSGITFSNTTGTISYLE